jgi:OOP family OmpA-OmpF porin
MTRLHALQLFGLAGLGTLLGGAATPVLAQDVGNFYGGLSVGQARVKIDEPRITAGLLSQGLNTTAIVSDEKDSAYKLLLGYQFSQNFALEGGYFNLGKFSFQSTTAPAGSLNGEIKLQGLNLDLVGRLPLSERWSALARVGAQVANARDRFSGTGAVRVLDPNPSQRATNYKAGLGLQYAVSKSLLVRAEGERYRINDAVGNHGGVNVFSVSLVMPFGRAPEPAPRMMSAAPVYVAPAPAPAPAPMPAPPPPVAAAPVVVALPAPPPERRRVKLEADSLFSFDRADVKPEGRGALDRLVQDLNGTRFDVITVEGHTDRLGSAAYNQRLSSQRAEAVKAYLVGAGKLDANKISAVGKGESMPVTRAEDCKGQQANPKLIACLQPDRRVEVEVTGTR